MSGSFKRVAYSAALAAMVVVAGRAETPARLNRVIAQLERQQPVFGLHVPTTVAGRGANQAAQKTPADRAKDALAYRLSDFYYESVTEPAESFEEGLSDLSAFVSSTSQLGAQSKMPFVGFATPIIAKTPKILCAKTSIAEECTANRTPRTGKDISRILNLGAAGVFFVDVESAAEVRQGLSAMRFKSKGGTRPDDVGGAPAFWGMSEQEYRQKADLWPLNPKGELINWSMIEGKEGLAHAREIAAVKGIGVLWVGMGSLRSVFTTTNAAGEKVLDTVAHENAAMTVLAACKEFHVPCGIPAGATDIEKRLKQGFTVFASGFNEGGMKTVEIGRKATGRATTDQ